MPRAKTVFSALALTILVLPIAALGQGNVVQREQGDTAQVLANQVEIYGAMNGPGWVQSYAVTCSGKARLKVEIKDCCIAGDHFEASARSWDKKPTTVRILASGNPASYTGAWLRGFGADPLRALVNVRYLHGVNVFPAGFYLQLTCLPATSTLTYTDEGQVCDTSK